MSTTLTLASRLARINGGTHRVTTTPLRKRVPARFAHNVFRKRRLPGSGCRVENSQDFSTSFITRTVQILLRLFLLIPIFSFYVRETARRFISKYSRVRFYFYFPLLQGASLIRGPALAFIIIQNINPDGGREGKDRLIARTFQRRTR